MPPLIPFDPVSKKKNHNDGKNSQENDDSTKHIHLHFLKSKGQTLQKVMRKLRVFKDSTPEEYCKWWIDFDDLMPYRSFKGTDAARISLLQTILK